MHITWSMCSPIEACMWDAKSELGPCTPVYLYSHVPSRGLLFTYCWRILSELADTQASRSGFMMELYSNKISDNNISKHQRRICHVAKLELLPCTYHHHMLLSWNPPYLLLPYPFRSSSWQDCHWLCHQNYINTSFVPFPSLLQDQVIRVYYKSLHYLLSQIISYQPRYYPDHLVRRRL